MYLLDTHIFLWVRDEFTRLSTKEQEILGDPAQQVFVSAASIWEIAIKHQLKKLNVTYPEQLITDSAFPFLAIEPEDGWFTATLPFHHHDPFDRLIVAQAKRRGLTIITRDVEIQKYGVPVLPA